MTIDKTNKKAQKDKITHFGPDRFSFWTALGTQVD